ncbi:MAG: hypothetical protein QW035_00555 [Candidatus Anstonellales archaeon]
MLSEAALLVKKSVLSSIRESYAVAYPSTLPGALIIHIASKHIPPSQLPEEPSSYLKACSKAGVKRLLLPFPSSFSPSFAAPAEFKGKSFLKDVELFFPLKLNKLDSLMKGFDDEERIELLSEVCCILGAKHLCSLPPLPQKS